jgi:hypothetical protein
MAAEAVAAASALAAGLDRTVVDERKRDVTRAKACEYRSARTTTVLRVRKMRKPQ